MKHKYILAIDEYGCRVLYYHDTKFILELRGFNGKYGIYIKTHYDSCNAIAEDYSKDERSKQIDSLIGTGVFGLKRKQMAIVEVDRKPIHGKVIEKMPLRNIETRFDFYDSSDGADQFSWTAQDVFWEDKYDCIPERLAAA